MPDNLPIKLIELQCTNNNLSYLPEFLPDSLKFLNCTNNKLSYINKLPNNMKLKIKQSKKLDYITYNSTIKLNYDTKIKVDNIIIKNQDDYDKYMQEIYDKYIVNKTKSAKK